VFPWGLRGLVQSHPFASVHRINNRTSVFVRWRPPRLSRARTKGKYLD
jgi:hypothetical protein